MYIFLFYEKEGFLVSLRKGVDTRDTRHRRDSFGSTLNKKIQTKEYKSMIALRAIFICLRQINDFLKGNNYCYCFT